MSIKSQPYYWLTCDSCGAASGDESDYAAWGDESQALNEASSDGWLLTEDGRHYCEGCASEGFCWECGREISADNARTDSQDKWGCAGCDKSSDD